MIYCSYLLWKLLVVRVDSGDSLPAHNCCSCVGELETKWRRSSAHSRHLGIRLTTVLAGFQILYMCEKHFLTCYHLMIRPVNQISCKCIDFTDHLQMHIRVFRGMDMPVHRSTDSL